MLLKRPKENQKGYEKQNEKKWSATESCLMKKQSKDNLQQNIFFQNNCQQILPTWGLGEKT